MHSVKHFLTTILHIRNYPVNYYQDKTNQDNNWCIVLRHFEKAKQLKNPFPHRHFGPDPESPYVTLYPES